MIEAVRWRPFLRWFLRQGTSRLRASFGSIQVRGLEQLREHAAEAPLLIIANHTSWWDSLVALWLSVEQLEDVAFYGMMDAANLEKLRFFRWIGVFGVDRTSRRDGARVVRYALELLRRRGTAIWMFPQGAERPPHEPLKFEPGAAGIAKRAPAVRVIPVALSYVFEGEEKPNIYVSIGAAMPHGAEGSASREAQAAAVEAELAVIRTHLETRGEAFVPMMQPETSALSAWATAWLDRFAGWLIPRQRARRLAAAKDEAPALPPASPTSLREG
ncbi:MAG: lysophospholipid acyltransferase family protein [Myxococcota bacterium]